MNTKKHLKAVFEKTKQKKGPILISVKITRGKNVNKRIALAPIEIKTRFMKSISKSLFWIRYLKYFKPYSLKPRNPMRFIGIALLSGSINILVMYKRVSV